MFRVIFCANQVSLCIAVALAQKNCEYVTTIFYIPARCDSLAYKNYSVSLIPFTKFSFIKFLMATKLARPDEVCVPHMKMGRLINAYSKYARTLSAIDDGMDTFREKPRNIIPEYFSNRANYYTFTYSFPLATWLSRFLIKKTCDIRTLAISSRPQASLSNITEMVIESPGIGDIYLDQKSNISNILIVKHSNRHKNTINISGVAQVIGSEIGLENTINNFSGSLIVGESMVMIYALLCGNSDLKIKIMLTKDAFDNLSCLRSLLVKLSHDNLTLSDR